MLDKVTEDSFTKTGKGLLTLFCIGVVHLALGVKLENVSINVPWLPDIVFEHPENMSYLFLALLVYSIYRYWLHSLDNLEGCKVASLSWGFHSSYLGRSFIGNTININGKQFYATYEGSNKGKLSSVSIVLQNSDNQIDETVKINYIRGVISCLELTINDAYGTPVSFIDNHELRTKWGFHQPQEYVQHEDNSPYKRYKSYRINNYRLRLWFDFIRAYSFIAYSTKEPKTFDFLMPIILNLFLIGAWIHIKF